MRRHRSAAGLWAALAVVALSGCQNLYEDAVDARGLTFYEADDPKRPFLGVVVNKGDGGGGVKVEQVLAGGPAAQVGIVRGDNIVRYGARRINSTSDLVKAIRELGVYDKVEVTLDPAGSDAFRSVRLQPTTESGYAEIANREIVVEKDVTRLPFLFASADYTISRQTWKAHQGFDLPRDAQPYSAFELLPIFTFSLISVEDTDVFCDASRFKFLHWPLRMTSGGGPDDDVASAYSYFREYYVRL